VTQYSSWRETITVMTELKPSPVCWLAVYWLGVQQMCCTAAQDTLTAAEH
jgi:hypothetical protein